MGVLQRNGSEPRRGGRCLPKIPVHPIDAGTEAVHAEDLYGLTSLIVDFESHTPYRDTLQVERNGRAVNRVGSCAGVLGLALRGLAREKTVGGSRSEQVDLRRHHFLGQLLDRCNIVHDPEAAAIGCHH